MNKSESTCTIEGMRERRWEEKGMTEDEMVGWHH